MYHLKKPVQIKKIKRDNGERVIYLHVDKFHKIDIIEKKFFDGKIDARQVLSFIFRNYCTRCRIVDPTILGMNDSEDFVISLNKEMINTEYMRVRDFLKLDMYVVKGKKAHGMVEDLFRKRRILIKNIYNV